MTDTEDFDLFLAKERVRQAELTHKGVEDSLLRTKARATSLLGWAITLTSASVAAVATASRLDYRIEALISAVGFFATSVLCVKVLYSTRTTPLMQPPGRFDAIMQDGDELTESGFYKAFSEFADEIDTINDQAVAKDQKTMRLAWIAACATPIAMSLTVFWFWVSGWCSGL
ncbi:hypothetical protein [Acetobacter okinawensis]|uniref:hypothetical protein n=1 Tax=Acetobacter okinawensis TaxID=1076594 RepID=UPI00209E7077|nr:hypothetical protein [Acetobacter okinawensis]MCP1214138.1 hypothetical protein [Acetobacter okinawensis]